MKKLIYLCAATVLLVVGCKNQEKKAVASEEIEETVTTSPQVVDSHTSENALDWAGVYEGTTPCADCDGIKTVVTLTEDKTYSILQTYLGKPESRNEFIQKGDFVWDPTGTKVLLKAGDETFQYQVGENQLWQLDNAGEIITGNLEAMYVLKKIN
ncbi:copper resistance protein NlpE [Aequorivita sp. Q41]|uniref:copper resistance protein NlpE n=1 Tax=Aequorivita sp. Q41 TaxID=3153300 RepID=UPI003242C394